ncbi:MAG: hypothetical protein DYG98_14275 [Haliscomenobacteraceae bacterium CHB4]|nr:hypothetical protein [Haliscomenobacteraceae bacterium CHB4]
MFFQVFRAVHSDLFDGVGGAHDDEPVGLKQVFKKLVKIMRVADIRHYKITIADGSEVATGEERVVVWHCEF